MVSIKLAQRIVLIPGLRVLFLLLHQLDQVISVAFTLLNRQIYEIFIFFLVVVSDEIWMQVNILKEADFFLSHGCVLNEHSFYRNQPLSKSSLEHYGAITS